jgi:hypothetical protein
MGKSVTPKYRIESRDNQGKFAVWAPKVRATPKALAEYMDDYNRSFLPGGVNWHVSKACGVVVYHSSAKLINQSTGEIVASWSASPFQVL